MSFVKNQLSTDVTVIMPDTYKKQKRCKRQVYKKEEKCKGKRYLPADRIQFFCMYTLPQPKAVHKNKIK